MKKKTLIDDQTVKHVAELARLGLSGREISLHRVQLGKILEYIDNLNRADISGTPPTSHSMEGLKNIFRKDVRKPSLPVREALKNAPKKKGSFFSVPAIME